MFAAVAAVAVTAAGCTAESAVSSIADEHGLAGLDAREVIERLDATSLAERSTDLIASVQPDELVLTSGDRTQALPMPSDEFYLSVAP